MSPRATYRLQLHAGFDFAAAAALADHLRDLGVSHVYCSPYLQAAAGSTHGYDVVDHARVNDDLGGAAAHLEMCRRFGEAGLGQVLDIVPNHMAIGPDNRWWWDVLENGPSSPFAAYFDVDWDPPEAQLRNLVLVPVLGDHFGRVLENQELRLAREGGRFAVHYHEHRFPLAPRSLDSILGPAAERTSNDTLAFLAASFGSLPLASSSDPEDAFVRHRDKEVLAQLLDATLDADPRAAAAVDEILHEIERDPDRLEVLLRRQNYRLARWQLGTHQLDYRRFFDVSGLVGLRAEDERVFRATHDLVLGWLRTGLVDGVRIDHVDGLRDPAAYLERLREAAPDAWVLIEKILLGTEPLADWPVAGTTGYEFIRLATGLLVDPAAEPALTALYHEVTGRDTPWPELQRDAKREVLERVLAADLARLTNTFTLVCEHHRRHRDYSREELSVALRETLVAFPVYRTYARRRADGSAEVSARDRQVIDETFETVARDAPEIDQELLELLRRILLLELEGDDATSLSVGFQQLSGPTMAKGVEDTAFYRYHRFVALNEVGGEPGTFAVSPTEFHHANELVATHRPTTMLTTSTHDTKRSEDVRARLAALSEVPERWATLVRSWMDRHDALRAAPAPGAEPMPDRNIVYLLYQTLVGAHPLSRDRAEAFLRKAAREAKEHTSWLAPDDEYETRLIAFLDAILADDTFLAELDDLVAQLDPLGRVNSLTQLMWKLTAPGVPDIYQGTELWDHSLVDPDNRRPVDYDERRRLLADLANLTVEEVVARTDEGLPKLWLITRALEVRVAHPEAFGPDGTYEIVAPRGARADHVVAFRRGARVVSVTQRLSGRRDGTWDDTTLALGRGTWRDALTGARHDGPDAPLAEVLAAFPVALLVREDP